MEVYIMTASAVIGVLSLSVIIYAIKQIRGNRASRKR